MSSSLSTIENNSLTGEEMEGVAAYPAQLSRENSWEKNLRATEHRYERRKFCVELTEDLLTYQRFLENKSWGAGGCPFILEWPYETIPGMIHDKIVRRWLDSIIENRVWEEMHESVENVEKKTSGDSINNGL